MSRECFCSLCSSATQQSAVSSFASWKVLTVGAHACCDEKTRACSVSKAKMMSSSSFSRSSWSKWSKSLWKRLLYTSATTNRSAGMEDCSATAATRASILELDLRVTVTGAIVPSSRRRLTVSVRMLSCVPRGSATLMYGSKVTETLSQTGQTTVDLKNPSNMSAMRDELRSRCLFRTSAMISASGSPFASKFSTYGFLRTRLTSSCSLSKT
mmetsp:Transcript_3470/g.7325  ORF Transcript_3470/g.7325 Transcript_3470/m.7325 type:complete len:212 (+) Transcript_3470:596-1231(+)